MESLKPYRLEAKMRHNGSQKSEASNFDEKKHSKGREKPGKKKIQCYCGKNFGIMLPSVG